MSNKNTHTKREYASLKEELKKFDITAGLLTALCFSFLVGIYAPYELYLTNPHDFWFNSSMLIRPTLFFAAAMFFIMTVGLAIARLINRRVYYVALISLLIATIATYIQGTFLVDGLPPMDGTYYDWSQPSPERIKSIAVWLLLGVAAIFIALKFRGKGIKLVASSVSVVLLFMLLTGFVSLFVTNKDKVFYPKDTLVCSKKNQYQMSTDQNFIILVLDAVDSTKFHEALQMDPDHLEAFDGFTYYDNLLSGYVYTKESFPFLLSGEWYENDEDFYEYQNRVISESALLKSLEDRNYKIGLYASFNDNLRVDTFGNRIEINAVTEVRISELVSIRISRANRNYTWNTCRSVIFRVLIIVTSRRHNNNPGI